MRGRGIRLGWTMRGMCCNIGLRHPQPRGFGACQCGRFLFHVLAVQCAISGSGANHLKGRRTHCARVVHVLGAWGGGGGSAQCGHSAACQSRATAVHIVAFFAAWNVQWCIQKAQEPQSIRALLYFLKCCIDFMEPQLLSLCQKVQLYLRPKGM